ncbi:MAG: hypothetical protein AAF108_02755 [Planctomycetota bacterium]
MVAMPGFLVCAILLMAFMPLHIDVRRDRIHVAKGNSSYAIKSEQVREAMIETSGEMRRMTIRYRGRGGREQSRSFVIGDAVDVNALAMLLEHLRDAGADHVRTS